MTDKSYDIFVTDPKDSAIELSSGAKCELTKPSRVVVDPDNGTAALFVEAPGWGRYGVMAYKASPLSVDANSAYAKNPDTGLEAIVHDQAANNAATSYLLTTPGLQAGANVLSGDDANTVYKEVLDGAGVNCTDAGQKVHPVLGPEDIENMATKARGHLVKPPTP